MVGQERRMIVIVAVIVMGFGKCSFSGGHCLGLARTVDGNEIVLTATLPASGTSYTEKRRKHTTRNVRQIAALG